MSPYVQHLYHLYFFGFANKNNIIEYQLSHNLSNTAFIPSPLSYNLNITPFLNLIVYINPNSGTELQLIVFAERIATF